MRRDVAIDPEAPRVPGYELVARIDGAAGFGVYRARCLPKNTDALLEVFPAGVRPRGKPPSHADLAPHLDTGVAVDGRSYVALEAKGPLLAERLARGPLSPREAVAIALSIARALEVLHARRIAHGGLSPRRILLPDPRSATLAHFATTERFHPEVSAEGELVASPSCLAPEQLEAREVDGRADLYALGCVIVQCLTGRAVHRGPDAESAIGRILWEVPPPLSSLLVDIPPELDQLVAALLAKHRDARIASATQVRRALEGFRGAPTSALRPRATSVAAQADRLAARFRQEPLATPAPPSRREGAVLFSVLVAGVELDEPALHLLERAGLEARNLGDGRWVVVGQARWPVDGARAAWEIAHALGPRAEAAHAFLSDEAVGAEPPLAIEESGVTCNPALATLLSLGAELTESEAPARTPFTGRRREIAALAGSLARCRSRGEAAVVALSGEPGIGKTRLLARFCEQLAAAAKPPRVLCASTTSFDRDLPFSCLARLWAHAAGLDATASPGDVASALPKLTGWRSGDLATRHVAQGFFAERLRPEHGLRPLHRQALAARKEVGRAFLTWCDELTRDQPLVLALDLARGIDSASREVLRRVVQTFARRSLLLVVANRRGSSLGLEPQLRLELQPLRGREADDLARALALPTPPPEMSGHPWLLEVAALGARRHTPRAP